MNTDDLHHRVLGDAALIIDACNANLLNDFFASVQTDETPLMGEIPIKDPKVTEKLRFTHFSEADVIKKINRLRFNKACGPNGIHVNVLKRVPAFAKPSTVIFNESVYIGVIPQDWRDGNVTPLHKSGSRKSCNNYRPVTLTSQIVKLLERLILDQLQDHLIRNNVISCKQHGFQSKCSCVTQLIESLNDWCNAFDDKIETDIIYVDFSKAFDTVAHQCLLYKLLHYGIDGHIKDQMTKF